MCVYIFACFCMFCWGCALSGLFCVISLSVIGPHIETLGLEKQQWAP